MNIRKVIIFILLSSYCSIKFCWSCVVLFLIDFQTHMFGYPWISKHTVFYCGIKVHPCDLNAGTHFVYHLMNYQWVWEIIPPLRIPTFFILIVLALLACLYYIIMENLRRYYLAAHAKASSLPCTTRNMTFCAVSALVRLQWSFRHPSLHLAPYILEFLFSR